MTPSITDDLDLSNGTKVVVFIALIFICYYAYAIEKRQRQQLRALHTQTRALGNGQAAIHQELLPEEKQQQGETAELAEEAEEAVEEWAEQAAEADAGNE